MRSDTGSTGTRTPRRGADHAGGRDPYTAAAVREYRLISADSHVNEPPGLWRDRVPPALRDRAPRIERFADGDAWVLDGVADPINFGLNACAGLEPEAMRAWARFEDLRRGGWDP